MIFAPPLTRGRLIKRYKRFLADVRLDDGTVVTAHCANSGSMLSVDEPDAPVWLSPAANPARKLRYTWEMIEIGGALVGINTALPNRLVADAIEQGTIVEAQGYERIRREVPYGRNSRIDILLETPDRPRCYVEVKNVTLKRAPGPAGLGEFPDSVTARGTKHLSELADAVRLGDRAILLFLAQRGDVDRFAVAADIDPAYAAAFRVALDAGVEAYCYQCHLTDRSIEVARSVPVVESMVMTPSG